MASGSFCRAVAKYLKDKFKTLETSKLDVDQVPRLSLENLLTRRTRREAARMFFEILVISCAAVVFLQSNMSFSWWRLYLYFDVHPSVYARY